MATPTRASTCRTSNEARVGELVDELRAIRQTHDGGTGRQFLSEFATRQGLTHRDIDVLLVALSQDDAASPDPGATGAEVVLSEVPEEAQIVVPDGDLAWMFREEPEAPPLRAVTDLVGRAFDDLLGDWSRRGGHLTRADVALLASTRGLLPDQYCELLDLLTDARVELPDPTGPRPMRAAEQRDEYQGDAVGQYLRAIGRFALIDGPREVELWSLISQGAAAQGELDEAGDRTLAPDIRRGLRSQVQAGRRAHAELVCANLRLVVSIAKARHYESSGVDFADRIQDGNLGLMHAADKFDGSKGFKFSTYATWWIRQSIERGIADKGNTIRVPAHVYERVRKVRRTAARLAARLDRQPSLAEVADATGMEPGQVQAVLDLVQSVVSLDHLLGDGEDLRLSDVLAAEEDRDGRADPAEIVAHAMMREDLMRGLAAVLSARAVEILERRFGIGTGDEETLDEIGASFGVTRERIRQIQKKSLDMLRQDRSIASLRAYVMDDSEPVGPAITWGGTG
ncbi:RNA polymerase sigma factor RpoD/SigA [Kutzneria buriramensis]|uniref:RNA polymerase sigma factor (Sigma-70 family) n=1 Tax=Kutzneria buriramensis TaxID=1045776 RepID=A0A3E0HR23_9PSEU|nr:sigma-70 family RNA polymerase sigma factor [Kutzneria buriramensis]REH48435.1 RNA polymerase sigma factor (sigma-70 family) [Kutzneria buriramensis]